MPISISEEFSIDQVTFEKTGALDAILDIDSRFFIDPHLLRKTKIPELKGSYQKVHAHFAKILKLMLVSKDSGDRFWREADKLFQFPELPGICLGYSSKGVTGSGMGKELRARLLKTTKEVIDAGIRDPEIFEIVGLLEENIGCDRISDMIGRIIYPDLMAYTHRVFSSLGIKGEKYSLDGQNLSIPKNPYPASKPFITLVPRTILNDLPIAYSWGDIDLVCSKNHAVRLAVNKIIGNSWKEATNRFSKKELKEKLLRNPELLKDLIESYKGKPEEFYDFENDPAGQIIWHPESQKYSAAFPLNLSLRDSPSLDDVENVVLKICNKFKDLIENNNLSKLLYKPNRKPKHEEAAQLVFYGIADCYCEANNLDLTREANAGRGPVDFKVSKGYVGRVVTELKLSSNPKLVHGFETQLIEYQKAEKTERGIYLIVDVGRGKEKIKAITDMYNNAIAGGRNVPKIILVNGVSKESASKYKKPKQNTPG